jgi:hypothetical protein
MGEIYRVDSKSTHLWLGSPSCPDLMFYHRSNTFGPGKDTYWKPLPDNDSPDNYAAFIDGFFRATLRCRTGHPSGYDIPLTEVQATNADQLLACLMKDEYNAEEILSLLHRFTLSLLIEQPEPEVNDPLACKWTCPIRCYLAVHAIRDDGNFISPKVLTPRLARFKYFCANCALIQADRTKDNKGGMIE